jgi:rod shape-determining protein MreC
VSFADKAKERAKKNPTWLLVILLALHLIGISFNRSPDRHELWILQVVLSTITTPAQSILANGTAGFKNLWNTYFSMRDARLENEQLRADRAQLETKLIEEREKVRLLEQMEALQKWQVESKYEGVQARVVARDANRLFNTVFIDKGSSSGIVKDQPVVTAEGLVGRVINAMPFSAQVLLITDERHGAGAIIGQTEANRLLGVVRGKSDYLCEMKFIAPPEKIENGEQVITSGQDGIYPKGLLIGRVKKPDGGLAVAPQVVEVEPAAQLGKLEIVSVLAVQPNQLHREFDDVTHEGKKQEKAPDQKKDRPRA